jgi:hypothetical protein
VQASRELQQEDDVQQLGQTAAFVVQRAGDLQPVLAGLRRREDQGAGAAVGIGAGEGQAAHAGLDGGPVAHAARLQGGQQRVVQVVPAGHQAGQAVDLGVGHVRVGPLAWRPVFLVPAVAALGDDSPGGINDHDADRSGSAAKCLPGQSQGPVQAAAGSGPGISGLPPGRPAGR